MQVGQSNSCYEISSASSNSRLAYVCFEIGGENLHTACSSRCGTSPFGQRIDHRGRWIVMPTWNMGVIQAIGVGEAPVGKIRPPLLTQFSCNGLQVKSTELMAINLVGQQLKKLRTHCGLARAPIQLFFYIDTGAPATRDRSGCVGVAKYHLRGLAWADDEALGARRHDTGDR